MSGVDDELVSQFLMFTGTDDTAKALSYLEMSAGDLERAVSLFMDHTAGGGGGSSGDGPMAMASDEVRAPDATRTMRLMDDIGPGHAHMPMMPPVILPQAFGASSSYDSVRQAINAAAAVHHADEDYDYSMNQEDEDEDDDEDYEYQEVSNEVNVPPRLADMFAPPEHLIYKEGGFDGARTMAKDSKRWLLVNIQKDSEFSCHALNRDVWRDELVENLIREGFIFWQAMDQEPQGQVYTQRYHVHDYPHVAIIDPRTRRLMWKKEGWTQQDPLTASSLAEIIMDFCSRNSFDKPIRAAPRPPPGSAGAAAAAAQRPTQRPMSEMTEEEQLQAAMRASLEDVTDAMDAAAAPADDTMQDEGDDEVEYVGSFGDASTSAAAAAAAAAASADEKPAAVEAKKEPSLLEQLLEMSVGDEPASGARIQLRMPDGKRLVRKFDSSSTVKTIYAFIAQSSEDAKGGKEFVLMAGYPPKDLITDMDSSIDSCQLNGQAITVRWK